MSRIVEGLRTPGLPAEQLLEVMTCRFGDGREIALDAFPLARALGSAETVRAEEIMLSVPDGRSVATLVNATPIHGEDSAVESVVVTMQDLAPLQELERQRAEFLGMVSHELRAPLTSIMAACAWPRSGETSHGTNASTCSRSSRFRLCAPCPLRTRRLHTLHRLMLVASL